MSPLKLEDGVPGWVMKHLHLKLIQQPSGVGGGESTAS